MLSKKAQYAFHALTVLAKHQEPSPLAISAIVQSHPISTKFLETILLQLRKGGILGSKKGKGGGYYLMRPAEDITLAELVRMLDGPIAPLKCVSLNFYERCENCVEATCGLHNVMTEVRDANLKVLESKTLADICVS